MPGIRNTTCDPGSRLDLDNDLACEDWMKRHPLVERRGMQMKVKFLVITWLAWTAMGAGLSCPAVASEKGSVRADHSAVVPQFLVECTGWHALCSASTDCRLTSEGADCDCWAVDETHIVATSEIQDPAIKRLTERRCTNKHPCDVDEAPVCGAIRDGEYEVDGVRYPWVSTFSYRGWCDFYQPKACDPTADGYVGDYYWAICDAAPCSEVADPPDPERPLRCQCRVKDGSFVGTKDSCTGENGGIISAMELSVWDFDNDTWPFPMPGFDYIKGACDALKSDPLPW